LSSTVPTPSFLNGDFSAFLDKSVVLGTDNAGQMVYGGAIIDPQTGDAFPGNIIPPQRFSAVSRKIIDLYKAGYQPLAPTLTNNNALPLSSPATWYHSDEVSTKLDYDLSATHRLDGSIIFAYIPRLLSDQGGIWSAGTKDGGPMANAYDHNTTAPSVRFRDSSTISNSLLNVFSVTFNRFRNPSAARSRQGNWPEALGLGNFGAGNFPIIKFQGINNDQHRYIAGSPLTKRVSAASSTTSKPLIPLSTTTTWLGSGVATPTNLAARSVSSNSTRTVTMVSPPSCLTPRKPPAHSAQTWASGSPAFCWAM
jgi:hypothetical protein